MNKLRSGHTCDTRDIVIFLANSLLSVPVAAPTHVQLEFHGSKGKRPREVEMKEDMIYEEIGKGKPPVVSLLPRTLWTKTSKLQLLALLPYLLQVESTHILSNASMKNAPISGVKFPTDEYKYPKIMVSEHLIF